MKKIIGVILIALAFAFSINLVYANENQNYIYVVEDIENYSQTTHALKIRFTHFLNTVEYKIDQINFTINRLEENNIDTSNIRERLIQFEVIKEEIEEILRDHTLNQDDLILRYVSLKQDALNLVSRTREVFKEVIPPEIHSQISSIYRDRRIEVRDAHRENIQNLVKSHNQEMRLKMQNNFNQHKKIYCADEGCFQNRDEIRQGFQNRINEDRFKQNLEHRQMVLERKQTLNSMNENRKEVMQNRTARINIGGTR